MERNLASSGTSEACVSKLRRFTELDSIRGIAAVTVVLSHFQELWLPKDIALTPAPWKRAMNLALHPVDGGHEAVILFFLLSGFVLALPYAVGRQSGYVAFLVRRILRIYGPYLVALCLAVGCVYVWHGDLHHGAWAARIWSQPPNLHLIVQHLLFLGAYNSSYNPVFWSLVYEMRISLLFPLLVALVLRIGNWTVVLVALCLSGVSMFVISQYPQSLWGYSLMMTLHYIGFFMLGILLSVYHQELGTYYRSLSVGLKLALVLTSF